MAQFSREVIFKKLDELAFKAMDSAWNFADLRGDGEVTLLHWLNQILHQADSDLHRIVRAFHIDEQALMAEMTAALSSLSPRREPYLDLAPEIEQAVERGWIVASMAFDQPRIRTAHLLLGILEDPSLKKRLVTFSSQFLRIDAERLAQELETTVRGSPEDGQMPAVERSEAAPAGEAGVGAARGRQEALQRFTRDLTEEARAGRIDPVVGRDEEIRQIIDILMRRRQNNPILLGEAGVGKTAVVEGLALRLAKGDVPPAMQAVQLRTLDVGLLQAGASMKGEFEQRLRSVIEDVQASAKPIVLFIDEAHTLIGAGGAAGTGDAANLLKPALARGTLRTIAATTWAEYKEFIEKDAALTRRFQPVTIDEPAEAQALRMLRDLAPVFERHHKVHILDEALEATVRLSRRYIQGRQLPDKAVSVLDTVCARVAMSQAATPGDVEDAVRAIEALDAEASRVTMEGRIGHDVTARQAELATKLEAAKAKRATLEERHGRERELAQELLALRSELVASEGIPPAERLDRLRAVDAELRKLQGEAPLILTTVDAGAVAQIIADWTGVPVGRMMRDEIDAVLHLAETLKGRIIGQDHALEAIARRIETARAGLDNPEKPTGVFLLVGPSGVGKTETALALAESLYGGEQQTITINMSEFKERHTVSTLKGAPPGYVGYGRGGRLTEAVRRKPYSVVLLDEIEKAHPDVHELFFQVFDKGVMEDGEGRRIDFKNTLIILTSNVATDLIAKLCADPDTMPSAEALAGEVRPELLKVFPPALLGRLVVVPYFPLSDANLDRIIRLQLDRIRRRVEAQQRLPFSYDEAAVSLIRRRCTEVESGGRMIDAILTNTVLPRVSRELLLRRREGLPVQGVEVSATDNDFVYRFNGEEATHAAAA
jgi:type VI secretion system protein VasG